MEGLLTFLIRTNVDFHQAWKAFEFWCEGVLFSAIGLFGLVTNIASVATFLSADLRTQVMVMMMMVMVMVNMMLNMMVVMALMNAVLLIMTIIVMNIILVQTFNQLLAVLAGYNIL